MRDWTNKISTHVSYTEATKSDTAIKRGIDNTPSPEQLVNMVAVAENVFEPVREHFKVPIAVTSFFRSPQLNRAVGGSSTSDHLNGAAMDLDADVLGLIRNVDIFNYIKDNLEFNQLIWEFGDNNDPDWVHVSYYQEEGKNKNEVLVAYKTTNWMGQKVTRYKKIK